MNTRLLALLTIFLWSFTSLKSQNKLDSLQRLVDNAEGLDKIHYRIDLALTLMYSDPQRANAEAQIALEEAEVGKFEKAIAEALLTYGAVLNVQRSFYEAEEILLKAIEKGEAGGWKDVLCKTQLNIGVTYNRKGEYKKAAEAHFTGLELAREIGDSDLELTHVMNLGVLKIQIGLLDEAEKYLKEALEKSISNNDKLRQGQLYGNLGYLEYVKQNIGNSIDYHQKSVDMFLQIGHKLQTAIARNNLGFAHAFVNEFDKAEEQYKLALSIYEEAGNTGGKALVLLNQAKLQRSRGNLQTAVRISQNALEVSSEIGFGSTLVQIYEFQYQVYEELSQFRNSLAAFKKYAQVRDSITTQTNQARIADLMTKYDFEQLANEAEIAEQEAQIQQLKLEQRNQLLVGVGVFLILLIFFLLWNRTVLKGKLSLSKREIDLKAKEHELEREKLIHFAEELALKNENLESQVRDVEEAYSSQGDDQNISMLEKLSTTLVDEKDWKKFNIYFDALYPDFYDSLKSQSIKKLTLSERRLAALIKLELTNKEMASLLNISRNSVVKAKYRLRQHLELEETKEMEDFIVNL